MMWSPVAKTLSTGTAIWRRSTGCAGQARSVPVDQRIPVIELDQPRARHCAGQVRPVGQPSSPWPGRSRARADRQRLRELDGVFRDGPDGVQLVEDDAHHLAGQVALEIDQRLEVRFRQRPQPEVQQAVRRIGVVHVGVEVDRRHRQDQPGEPVRRSGPHGRRPTCRPGRCRRAPRARRRSRPSVGLDRLAEQVAGIVVKAVPAVLGPGSCPSRARRRRHRPPAGCAPASARASGRSWSAARSAHSRSAAARSRAPRRAGGSARASPGPTARRSPSASVAMRTCCSPSAVASARARAGGLAAGAQQRALVGVQLGAPADHRAQGVALGRQERLAPQRPDELGLGDGEPAVAQARQSGGGPAGSIIALRCSSKASWTRRQASSTTSPVARPDRRQSTPRFAASGAPGCRRVRSTRRPRRPDRVPRPAHSPRAPRSTDLRQRSFVDFLALARIHPGRRNVVWRVQEHHESPRPVLDCRVPDDAHDPRHTTEPGGQGRRATEVRSRAPWAETRPS